MEFIKSVYSIFGFKFALALSTRPESFIGDLSLWEKAENSLKEELIESKMEWTINEGDGAFYGPKIDITITDAQQRLHQCATVQLDFQLPRRFELQYAAEDGTLKTPVMIHRAILGSLERMMAMLIEHYEGRWPLWISPRQLMICPVSSSNLAYAKEIFASLEKEFFVDVDESDNSLPKKIRNATSLRYNYVLIVGDNEMNEKIVSFRKRGGNESSSLSLQQFVQQLRDEISNFQ